MAQRSNSDVREEALQSSGQLILPSITPVNPQLQAEASQPSYLQRAGNELCIPGNVIGKPVMKRSQEPAAGYSKFASESVSVAVLCTAGGYTVDAEPPEPDMEVQKTKSPAASPHSDIYSEPLSGSKPLLCHSLWPKHRSQTAENPENGSAVLDCTELHKKEEQLREQLRDLLSDMRCSLHHHTNVLPYQGAAHTMQSASWWGGWAKSRRSTGRQLDSFSTPCSRPSIISGSRSKKLLVEQIIMQEAVKVPVPEKTSLLEYNRQRPLSSILISPARTAASVSSTDHRQDPRLVNFQQIAEEPMSTSRLQVPAPHWENLVATREWLSTGVPADVERPHWPSQHRPCLKLVEDMNDTDIIKQGANEGKPSTCIATQGVSTIPSSPWVDEENGQQLQQPIASGQAGVVDHEDQASDKDKDPRNLPELSLLHTCYRVLQQAGPEGLTPRETLSRIRDLGLPLPELDGDRAVARSQLARVLKGCPYFLELEDKHFVLCSAVVGGSPIEAAALGTEKPLGGSTKGLRREQQKSRLREAPGLARPGARGGECIAAATAGAGAAEPEADRNKVTEVASILVELPASQEFKPAAKQGQRRGVAGNGERRCIRNDGKGWSCYNKAEEGFSYCEYHLEKLAMQKLKVRRGGSHSRRAPTEGLKRTSPQGVTHSRKDRYCGVSKKNGMEKEKSQLATGIKKEKVKMDTAPEEIVDRGWKNDGKQMADEVPTGSETKGGLGEEQKGEDVAAGISGHGNNGPKAVTVGAAERACRLEQLDESVAAKKTAEEQRIEALWAEGRHTKRLEDVMREAGRKRPREEGLGAGIRSHSTKLQHHVPFFRRAEVGAQGLGKGGSRGVEGIVLDSSSKKKIPETEKQHLAEEEAARLRDERKLEETSPKANEGEAGVCKEEKGGLAQEALTAGGDIIHMDEDYPSPEKIRSMDDGALASSREGVTCFKERVEPEDPHVRTRVMGHKHMALDALQDGSQSELQMLAVKKPREKELTAPDRALVEERKEKSLRQQNLQGSQQAWASQEVQLVERDEKLRKESPKHSKGVAKAGQEEDGVRIVGVTTDVDNHREEGIIMNERRPWQDCFAQAEDTLSLSISPPSSLREAAVTLEDGHRMHFEGKEAGRPRGSGAACQVASFQTEDPRLTQTQSMSAAHPAAHAGADWTAPRIQLEVQLGNESPFGEALGGIQVEVLGEEEGSESSDKQQGSDGSEDEKEEKSATDQSAKQPRKEAVRRKTGSSRSRKLPLPHKSYETRRSSTRRTRLRTRAAP